SSSQTLMIPEPPPPPLQEPRLSHRGTGSGEQSQLTTREQAAPPHPQSRVRERKRGESHTWEMTRVVSAPG
ncbi:hypothetical protein FD754_017953, partial [Muntiacus muntjak]